MSITEGTVVPASGNTPAAGTLSIAGVSPSGTHRQLLVFEAYRTTTGGDTDDCIDTVTFQATPGEALTRKSYGSAATPSRNAMIYARAAPSASAHAVDLLVKTSNIRSVAFALPLSGVDDTTPFDAAATPASGTSNSPSLTFASAVGDTPYALLMWRDDTITFTPGAGVTVIGGPTFSGGPTGGAHVRAVLLKKTGAASVTFNGTLSASADWLMVGLNANAYVPTPPVTDFSADNTTPTTAQTVAFTDASTNAPTSWAWDFGDGNTSTLQNPTHQYAAAGTYDVELVATNADGSDTETKVGYITVSEAPAAENGLPRWDRRRRLAALFT